MNRTILAVDDSSSIRQTVALALARGGYEVISAEDGNAGLAKARATRADLVITDLDMPGMNGLAMMRELRKLPDYAGVPVLFLSTEADPAVRQAAQTAGATGWMVKPVQGRELLAAVNKVLGG